MSILQSLLTGTVPASVRANARTRLVTREMEAVLGAEAVGLAPESAYAVVGVMTRSSTGWVAASLDEPILRPPAAERGQS